MKRIIPIFILALVFGGICESFFASNETVYVARKSVKEISKFDKPNEAAEFENFITKNKEGEVPKEKLNAAFLRAKKTLQKRVGLKSAISGVTWDEVGPNNVGGRTRALMWDPNDANHTKVWAGGVSGGIWYKDDIFDINTPWQNVDDFMANLAVSCITHDDQNSNIFYAGTGEGYYAHAGVRGAGIYKSTDGGATWSALGSTLEPAADFNFDYVQAILVSNGRIIASTRSRYCNRGGVLYSDDGGVTWSTSFTGDGVNCGNGSGNDFAGDIAQASNGDIYVSFGFSGDSDGIYKSTDNGSTWSKVYNAQSNEGRIELATAPSNSNVVYGLIEGYSVNAKIIKTTNAGGAWSYTSIPMYYEQNCVESASQDWTRGQDSYDLIAIVDPNNSNKLTVGGIDLHRSDDGGSSWYPISYWTGSCYQYVHADQHFAVYNPHNSNQLIFGNDGGVAVTENASASTPSIYHNNKGYNVTQFYAGAMPNNTDDIYLAGAQDNGSQLINSSAFPASSSQVTGGDGAFCHIDEDNPNVVITSYVYNNYFVSTNGGSSFNSYFLSDNGRFINPTIYSSANNTLIGAGNEDEFFTLNVNGSNTNPSVNLGGSYITALAFDPDNENNIYVATINRDIYKISNIYGTPSSTFISQIPASLDAFGYPKTIAFGASSDEIYIVRSNYDLKSVVHYNQSTSTWTDKTGNLPSMPVRWIWVNPENTNEAMIATETGVWSTDNINASNVNWGATNMDLANVRVDHLTQRGSDKKILASTHGRGMFTTDDFGTSTPDSSNIYSEDFSNGLNTGWAIYSDNAANWEWRGPNTSPYDVYFPIDNACDIRENQLIESTTPENGYMVFDGSRWEMGTNAESTCELSSYGNGAAPGPFNAHLISPIIDLSSYPESSVSFFVDARSYDTELLFEISSDGGNTWDTIGDIFQLYGNTYVGTVELPVSQFVGQSSQVQFKFLYVGHSYHAIIDDFEIIDQAVELPTRTDIEAVAINYYQENSSQVNYSVYYRNSGSATIDSTTVRIEIYDGNSNFLNVANEHVLYNIQPGDTVSIFDYLDVCAQNSEIGQADLTIRTYPDYYDWFEGESIWYNITTISVDLNCNTCPVEEEITECSGLLDDGSGDFNYNNNRICSWLINPVGNSPIEFTVDSMYLEEGYDFLIFMDGDNPAADTLAILTGNLFNQVITSTGGSMYIRMLSDEGVTNYGWYGGWTNGCPEANLCRQTGDFDYFDDNILSKRIHVQDGYGLAEENGELYVSVNKGENWNSFYLYVEDLDLTSNPYVSFDIRSNQSFDVRVDLQDTDGHLTNGDELRITYDGSGATQTFNYDFTGRMYQLFDIAADVDSNHINWVHIIIEPGTTFIGDFVIDNLIVGQNLPQEFNANGSCQFTDLVVTGVDFEQNDLDIFDWHVSVTNIGNDTALASDLRMSFTDLSDNQEGVLTQRISELAPGDTAIFSWFGVAFSFFGDYHENQEFDVVAYADWNTEILEPNIRNNEYSFKEHLTYSNKYCQDTIVFADCEGTFTDGSGSNNYLDNQNCSWLIQSPTNSPIQLVVDSMNLEAGYDFIYVFDGEDGFADTLAVLSDVQSNVIVNGTASSMYIQFITDGSATRDGFSASWSTCTDLDVDLAFNSVLNIIQTDTATVSTQFEIVNNGNSTASGYQYRINFQNVATGFTGGITFSLPDLEPDSVYYHDSETYMCYFKNQVNQDFKFYVDLNVNGLSESNYDNNSDTTTINLTLTCTECDGLTEYTDCEASFALEGGNGTYTNSQNCEWFINPDQGGPIKVDFYGFDVDLTDTLWVTNSNNQIIDVLTGQIGDTGIYYLEDEILLSFQNSGNVNATGFSATTTCGVDMVDYEPIDFNINASGKGSITYSVTIRNNGAGSRDSSSFNLSFFDENWNYLGYTGQWVLNLQGGETREITSYNGALNLCNVLSSTQFQSLNVVLGVDNDINVYHEEYDETNNEINKEINLNVDCDVCNGVTVLDDCLGTFNDGSDELNYDPEKYCSWQITSPNSDDIQLTFTEFYTEIDFDFVRVFDGVDSNSTLLGKFSGNDIPDTLIASSGNMFVDFNSDKYIVESGFTAKYECLQEVTENDVVFNLGSATAGQNSTVSIPVSVDQFTDMGGFSGKITFDENVFTNPQVEAVEIPNPNGFTVNTTVPGEISFLWEASDFVNGHDLANGSIIFNLNLDVGEADGDFIIDALSNQANWSASTFDAQAKGVVLKNGLVTILNTATISGAVATVNNELVDNSLVSVVSAGDTVNTSAVDGVYSLNVAPGNIALGFYNTEDSQPVRGINIIDIIGLRRHILGLSVYDEVREMVAADVNFDRNINIIDIISLRRIILGLSSDFNGELWKYIPVNNDLTTSDYVRDTYFDFEVGGNTTIDFEAIKLGDVNFDWTNPNAKDEKVIDLSLVFGEEDKDGFIPVYLPYTMQLNAVQFTLSSTQEIKEIRNNLFELSTNESNKFMVSGIWDSEDAQGLLLTSTTPLFYVKSIGEIKFTDYPTNNLLAHDGNELKSFDGSTSQATLVGNGADMNCISVYPVPVSNKLVLDACKDVNIKSITWFSTDGREVLRNENIQKAKHWEITTLPSTGAYVIKIESNRGVNLESIIVK